MGEPWNKGRTLPVEVLTPNEVQALLDVCSHRAPTGIRNHALITMLWRSGIRISEALALAPKDVNLDTGAITVLHGKGDRRRVVGIDPAAKPSIGRWLTTRSTLDGVHRGSPLFCTLAGGPLQTSYTRALLPRLARKAGIDKRVHAHGLRHTLAAELDAEGLPLTVMSAQLGHTSVATTNEYLKHLTGSAAVQAMHQRRPPADLGAE